MVSTDILTSNSGILLTSSFLVQYSSDTAHEKLNSMWLISPLMRRIFNKHANIDAP